MYSIRKSKYHCYFGIKNIHLAKILDEINIPYIKLEDIEIENDKVPSLHTFDELYPEIEYTCALHSKICGRNYYPTDYRCSLRKCINIYNWKNKKIIGEMTKGLRPM